MAGWRRFLVIFGTLGVLALSAQYFFRHHRPGLDQGQRYGIDVSHHQGEIDWELVADDDIEFAYIKATEGGDWIDPRFSRNWEGARAAGIDVSAYHFFTECRTGAEQATNFLTTVPWAEVTMPLALDLEFAGACSDPMTEVELRAEVASFIDTVEAESGLQVMVYLLPDFEERYQLEAELDQPRWVRSLYHRPDDQTEWTVWQYSATTYIDGIEGGVDLDVGQTGSTSE